QPMIDEEHKNDRFYEPDLSSPDHYGRDDLQGSAGPSTPFSPEENPYAAAAPLDSPEENSFAAAASFDSPEENSFAAATPFNSPEENSFAAATPLNSPEENSFSTAAPFDSNGKNVGKKKKNRKTIAVICVAVCLLAAIGVLSYMFLSFSGDDAKTLVEKEFYRDCTGKYDDELEDGSLSEKDIQSRHEAVLEDLANRLMTEKEMPAEYADRAKEVGAKAFDKVQYSIDEANSMENKSYTVTADISALDLFAGINEEFFSSAGDQLLAERPDLFEGEVNFDSVRAALWEKILAQVETNMDNPSFLEKTQSSVIVSRKDGEKKYKASEENLKSAEKKMISVDQLNPGDFTAAWNGKIAYQPEAASYSGLNVYADLVSIEPKIKITYENDTDDTPDEDNGCVCRGKTADGEIVWVYMTIGEYYEYIDSSAKLKNSNAAVFKVVRYSPARRFRGVEQYANLIQYELADDTATMILKLESIDEPAEEQEGS
ncbi:MAG: hypothetical protein IKD86_07220, partial [Firmicutes bacterium]|nr:hypothetical protein [Bacillota bacterium]